MLRIFLVFITPAIIEYMVANNTYTNTSSICLSLFKIIDTNTFSMYFTRLFLYFKPYNAFLHLTITHKYYNSILFSGSSPVYDIKSIEHCQFINID